MPTTFALILAGGSGQRYGADRPKQFVHIGTRTVLEHSVAAFQHSPHIDGIIVVAHPHHVEDVRQLLPTAVYTKLRTVVEGGAQRQDSTLNALAAVRTHCTAPLSEVQLLIHDAVRPAVSDAVIGRVCAALSQHQVVNLVTPVVDTLIEVNEAGQQAHVPDRGKFRRVQTPQGFHAEVLAEAYRLAMADPHFQATDDCGVVFRYLPHVPIALVEGDARNIKLTFPEDYQVLLHTLTQS